MTELHLTEGGGAVVVALDEAEGEALAASGVVTAYRAGSGRWEVAPTTKVGVVVVAGVTVLVRPKVGIRRILFLLGYARDPGWRLDTVAMAEAPDLLPALAQAFADQVERATEVGLLQGYTEVEDSLSVLRGRMREQDQLRQRFGLAVPLLVRFDDYTVDIPENRLLRAAVEFLLRLPGVPDVTRHRLRGIRLVLAEVGAPASGISAPSWTPTRLNVRYQVALWLAELILRGEAVDLASGDVRVGGFLVDMAKVYEDFLVAALIESFKLFGGRCRPQDRHHLDVESRIAMRPDLVWYRNGQPTAVLDAKYKVEKPAGFPDADLYQMLAYCTALGLPEGHLVYAKGNGVVARHEVRNAGISVVTHTLDLDQEPADLLAQVSALAAITAARSMV